MGAIKPPWITKEEFYRTPYNFCDRWCEYCLLTSICKVYKEGLRDRRRAIKEGKDPDSMEFAFEIIRKNFQKTFQIIYKGAKKWGIDMEEIEKEMKDGDWDEEPDYKENSLYQLSLKLNKKIHKLLKRLEYVSGESDVKILKREVEILSWYNPLFVAKIARALSSFKEEKSCPANLKTYDDKTFAFIAYQSLEKISNALHNLAIQKGVLVPKKKLISLSYVCLSIADLLDNKFGLFEYKKHFSN